MRWMEELTKDITQEHVIAFGLGLNKPAADEEILGDVPEGIRPWLVAQSAIVQAVNLHRGQQLSAEEAERIEQLAKRAELLMLNFEEELRSHLELDALLPGMRIASCWQAVGKRLSAEVAARIVLPTPRETTVVLATSRFASVLADVVRSERKAARRRERTRIRA